MLLQEEIGAQRDDIDQACNIVARTRKAEGDEKDNHEHEALYPQAAQARFLRSSVCEEAQFVRPAKRLGWESFHQRADEEQ